MATKSPLCPSCKNRVFFNEQLIFAGQPWHRQCLRCTTCKALITVDKACEHAGMPYCKTHYQQQFGPRGYDASQTATSRPESTTTSGTTPMVAMVTATGTGTEAPKRELFPTGCPKCGKRVFAAERTPAIGRDWHKLCLRCFECNQLLHAGGFAEHDKFPFCKKCYEKLWGAEGYGRSGARNVFAGVHTSDQTLFTEAQKPQTTAYASALAAAAPVTDAPATAATAETPATETPAAATEAAPAPAPASETTAEPQPNP